MNSSIVFGRTLSASGGKCRLNKDSVSLVMLQFIEPAVLNKDELSVVGEC